MTADSLEFLRPSSEPDFPAVHVVIVTRTDDPPADPADDTWPQYELEISHRECTHRGEECLVEGQLREGLAWCVHGSFPRTELVPEGLYEMVGWTSKTDIPGEPIEYDAGIDILRSPNGDR